MLIGKRIIIIKAPFVGTITEHLGFHRPTTSFSNKYGECFTDVNVTDASVCGCKLLTVRIGTDFESQCL
jgi:hypothetical protein